MAFKNIKRSLGFSLVELMVAMVLGLILIGGVVQVVISNIQTFNTNSGISRVQESARFALSELSHDIRMAGFRGCDVQSEDVVNYATYTEFNLDADIFGGNDLNGAFAGVNPAVTPVTDTDVFQVKRLIDVGTYLTAEVTGLATQLAVTGGEEFKVGDILYIGDCDKGAFVNVTNAVPNATQVSISNTGTISPNGEKYGIDAQIFKVEVKTYYVADSGYTNNQNESINALWVDKNGVANELVLGVDNFQVLYGVNTDTDDLAPNQFVEAQAVTNWNNVTVIRLMVNTTSFDAVSSDGVLSRDFALSVTLRNRVAAGVGS